jgi:CheY-like chemotaxis protein
VSAKALEEMFGRVESRLDSHVKKLLVVEDDPATQMAIAQLIMAADVEITEAKSGTDAFELLRSCDFDCAILDLDLGDMTGIELLRRLADEKSTPLPPVVVYTGAELSKEQHIELRQHSSSIVVKGASSPERLIDEVSLFLHSVESSLPEEERRMIRSVHETDHALLGKRVLLVDDDLRNTFALSKALRQHGLDVVLADNGELALEKLVSEDVDLVLMDIMMPVMDGYEAMRRIRAEERYRDLPIIALTAKAMLEDRAKCIEAGANDYLTKPVSIDQLLSMARIWLFQSR